MSIFSDYSGAGYFSWQNITSSLFLWFINIALILFCLIKLLVYGDPIVKPKSKEFVMYWKHKKQSDLDFERVIEMSCIILMKILILSDNFRAMEKLHIRN